MAETKETTVSAAVKAPQKAAPKKKRPTPKRKNVSARKRPATKPAATAQATAQKTATAARDSIRSAQQAAKSGFQPLESALTNSQAQFEKISQDASEIGKSNMDAVSSSVNIMAQGCEQMFKTSMSLYQSLAEKQMKFMKNAMGKKTLNELTNEIQIASQDNFNELMSGMTTLSEQCIRTAMDCFEPINDQVSKNVKKANDAMAA